MKKFLSVITGVTLFAAMLFAAPTTPINNPFFTGNVLYGAAGFTDTGVASQWTGSVNGYFQQIIQNTNSGTGASADVIVSNNLGTATTYFGDLGINSSTFTGTGNFSLPNATYLYSQNGDLSLGTYTNNAIHFIVNNGATDAGTISTAGAWSLNSLSSFSGQNLTLGTGTFGTALTFTSATGAATFAAGVTAPTLTTSGSSATPLLVSGVAASGYVNGSITNTSANGYASISLNGNVSSVQKLAFLNWAPSLFLNIGTSTTDPVNIQVNSATVGAFSTTGLAVTGNLSSTGNLTVSGTTDSTSTTTGSLQTAGGLGVAKSLYVGGTGNFAGRATVTLAAGGLAFDAIGNATASPYSRWFYSGSAVGIIGGADQTSSGASTNFGIDGTNAVIMSVAGTPRWSVSATGATLAGNLTISGTTDATTGGAGSLTTAGGIYAAKQIIGATGILSFSPTAGIGYTTGAGGTVTQATSRTTGVTLNKVSGAITLVSAAGSTSWQTFTVTDSAVAATDTISINQKSGTDKYMIHVTAVAAGSFNVTFATTGGTTTEQPVFQFNVIKGSNS